MEHMAARRWESTCNTAQNSARSQSSSPVSLELIPGHETSTSPESDRGDRPDWFGKGWPGEVPQHNGSFERSGHRKRKRASSRNGTHKRTEISRETFLPVER